MRILVGPPGSGKTSKVLEEARRRLDASDESFRLIAPTATMAEHFRNQLAGCGYVLRPKVVDTLAGFIEAFASAPQVEPEALLLLVEEALRRLRPASFGEVAATRGFPAVLADLIEELSSAGCGADRFAALELDSPYAADLAAIYSEVESSLAARGWALRGERVRHAAAAIASGGLQGIDLVLLDGFFNFTEPEIDLVAALDRHAEVVLTLPPWPGCAPARRALANLGAVEQELETTFRKPQRILVTAPTVEREADEIARRILEELADGRKPHEIGVIMRSARPYGLALRLAFGRYGIPARFYFAEPLAEHAVVRYFSLLIQAVLSGWDFETSLPAFEMPVSGIGATEDGDRLVFVMRRRMPDRGLEALRRAAQEGGASQVLPYLEALERLDEWRAQTLIPAQWAMRLRGLKDCLQGPGPELPAAPEMILAWRSHAAALAAFEQALDATAASLDPRSPLNLDEFWSRCRPVLGQVRLRVADRRREVVHVIDVYEARQWELPVVFVCGLIEKQFPLYASEDPLLGDAARARLSLNGVHLAATEDRREEERFLFDLALSRATSLTVLSYPKFDYKGEPNLPSFFLNDFDGRLESAPGVLPRPRRQRVAEPEPKIYDELLRVWIRDLHETLTPSGIESFMQCPFQFFGRSTLKLETAPPRQRERLDTLVAGGIVHEVLAAWQPGVSLDELFDRAFSKAVTEFRLAPGYRSEALRLEMIASLRRFLAGFPPSGNRRVRTEQPFRLLLPAGVAVCGRIDRFEVDPEGNAFIFDFKYSTAASVSNRVREHSEGRRVQGGLYLLAIERCFGLRPAAMHYCAMRGKLTSPSGWTTAEDLQELASKAEQYTLDAAGRIRSGAIRPEPADAAQCGYCEFRDGCRVEILARALVAAGEAE